MIIIKLIATIFLIYATIVLGIATYKNRKEMCSLLGNAISSIMMLLSAILVWN